jgi:hypothetical protein
MKTRIALGLLVMIFGVALPLTAGGKADLQKYFSDTAIKVKATENASEKREILNESFQTMSKALDLVQASPMISGSDIVVIDRFKVTLREKQDELVGANGFDRVSDEQLDAFSDYVVQDTEQATEFITISLVTLLLIIILIVLVVK